MNTRPFAISAVFGFLLIALTPAAHAGPFENLPDGSIRHSFSGFIFPKQIGIFKRARMLRYNRAGSDVSAGYNAGALIVATVYAYPARAGKPEEALSREYDSKRTEISRFHRGVVVLSEGPVSISQEGKKYVGKRGYFSFRDVFFQKAQDLKSELMVFRDGPLFVEYRFSYPRDHAEAAEREIEAFIEGWSWRGSPKT